jgi:hypothetical protein|tara:strand:- start:293 stop:625 length:333 start_codon:yes stop_codon:yes gene_type:complete
MAMVDVASSVLGGFQDSIVDAFGATAGWWVGHLLVVGILALSVVALQNRHHIANHSGFGRSTLMDATAILVLTAIQYSVFTGTFAWPEGVSLVLGIICAMTLRWHLLIVE